MRNNIVFQTLNQYVSNETRIKRKKNLLGLLASYKEENTFNLDEKGLFYKCMQNKTLIIKNEICSTDIQGDYKKAIPTFGPRTIIPFTETN